MKYILTALIFCSLNAAGQAKTGHIVYDTSEPQPRTYPCHHIYVAVLPDTLVWDKTVKSYESISNSVLLGCSVDTLVYNPGIWQRQDPKPYTQKIVCILCHKVTEQKIKIINEPKN